MTTIFNRVKNNGEQWRTTSIRASVNAHRQVLWLSVSGPGADTGVLSRDWMMECWPNPRRWMLCLRYVADDFCKTIKVGPFAFRWWATPFNVGNLDGLTEAARASVSDHQQPKPLV